MIRSLDSVAQRTERCPPVRGELYSIIGPNRETGRAQNNVHERNYEWLTRDRGERRCAVS
jgi:hypothetical protein